nr:transposase [Granulicella tundricola]
MTQHEKYTAALSSRVSEIERLVLLVEKLQRMLFGAKSEKVFCQIEQLELQLEELQAASAIEEIKRIAVLYDIEAEIRGSTADLFRTIRQARARPLLDSLFLWLETTLAKLSSTSDTAAAIRYAEDGQLEIDNNTAERALRVVALGRKNYLFCGSDAGGERAARLYSLLGSAKLNALDPELYLHHVLERIADHAINRIQDFLPWNVSINKTHTLIPK